ncbi:MAG: UbiA-like polyprenyltransferase [Chlamydiales bacterium]|nr:UbiA-like polyprenyltransferase [Chlamydiales bacterium]
MSWKAFKKLVMIEQTLFGLPWALIGALLPFANASFRNHFDFGNWSIWFWIFVAFSAARTSGMSFNRLIDSEMDALNPRTKGRSLPSGEVTKLQVGCVAWISLVLFIFSCAMLNTWCLLFSLIISMLLWLYSYTKRYTFFCHFVLGLIEFFAPFLGWVAVTGSYGFSTHENAFFGWTPLFLGSSILFWISGMDIVYATQDIDFDREHSVNSIPARFGILNSLRIARMLHCASVVFFVLAGIAASVTFLYYIGLMIVVCLFIYQHVIVQPNNLKRLHRAFFTCNSLIAVTQFVFTLGAILWIE